MEFLKELIVDVPDFPKPGIIFKDITPLLNDFRGFQDAVMAMRNKLDFMERNPDKIVGLEARGFFFAPVLAIEFECGFVPIRKSVGTKPKLPRQVFSAEYDLEYGKGLIDIHKDAIKKRRERGDRG